MLYFAYASNMDLEEMKRRCPSAAFVCIARLKDHILIFPRFSPQRRGGIADVVPAIASEAQDVWGVVYEIDDREIQDLDRAEGFVWGKSQNAYVREETQVQRDGDEGSLMSVQIYFAVRQSDYVPHSAYKAQMVEAARYWKLPEEYITKLEDITSTDG